MAEFTVEFERGTLPPPEYDDYAVTEQVNCNDDVIPRSIVFNNTGDFILGLNFSSNYPPATTIVIEDYKDITTETDVATYAETTPSPNSVSSELIRISTNTPLVFPYTVAVGDLYDIGIEHASLEIVCNDTEGKFRYTRERTISYRVGDSNGLYGEIKTSTLSTYA